MRQTLLYLRLIHAVFILTWFQFIFLLVYLHLPEHAVPFLYPLALGAVAVTAVFVCIHLRKQFLHEPAAILESQPENQALLNRWRTGNILSFTFAESTMLFGVLLKFLGERWRIVAIFFLAGLALILLWTPRAIKTKQ
jgi:hypothetical protein